MYNMHQQAGVCATSSMWYEQQRTLHPGISTNEPSMYQPRQQTFHPGIGTDKSLLYQSQQQTLHLGIGTNKLSLYQSQQQILHLGIGMNEPSLYQSQQTRHPGIGTNEPSLYQSQQETLQPEIGTDKPSLYQSQHQTRHPGIGTDEPSLYQSQQETLQSEIGMDKPSLYQSQHQTRHPRIGTDEPSLYQSQQQSLQPGIGTDKSSLYQSQQQTLQPGIGTDKPSLYQSQQILQPGTSKSSSITRTARNLAEKQRRDIINGHIAKMAALVPIIARSSRKMDKISILRLTGAHLRARYTLGDGSNSIRPPMLPREIDLEQFLLDSLGDKKGFYFVVTSTGKLVYVSRQVEQYIGDQIDLLGQSLYDYIHPHDRNDLMRNLTPEGMQPMSAPSPRSIAPELHDNNSNSSEDSSTTNHQKDEGFKNFQEQRRFFTIRMAQRLKNARNPKRDDPPTRYECYEILGYLSLAAACKNADPKGRERRRTSNDIIFTGVATLSRKRPITQLSLLDATKDEYITRHLVDGRIIYCDHRVSVVAGYLSEEVSGLNAFAFMHKDDFRWTMIGLRQMYDRAETFGSSCYRLLTKTGDFIYLRTAGYLEYDEKTQTVESFLCVNTLVSEAEGIRLIKEMKERFSATLSVASRNLIQPPVDTNSSNSSNEVVSYTRNFQLLPYSRSGETEDKDKLEKAIGHLISNLPSPISEELLSPSTTPLSQYCLSSSAAQANKVGVNKIDCLAITQGKGKVTQKQKSKHTIGKLINSSSTEQSPISDSESAMPIGKPLSMFEMMNVAHNNHSDVQSTDISVQSKTLSAHKPDKSSCAPRNHTSYLNVSQSANVLNAQESMDKCNVDMLSPGALNEGTACNIKVEHGIEKTFNCPEKQESILQYFDDSPSGSSIVSPGIEMHDRCPLKRIRSDEDLTMYNKKKSNDVYSSTNMNNEQQHVSYLKCRSFAAEYSTTTVLFNQYNDVNSQSMTIVESSNSSLHEVGTDCQQLIEPVAPLAIEQDKEFIELQDVQEDTLLSSELDTNPEVMMKIIDNLCNGSTDFESFNEINIPQLKPNDQMINDELNHTHYQLTDHMTMHDSRINVLVHDFQNPVLRARKENFSQIQIEHNMQKQILKSLKQDHYKIQLKKFGI